MDQTGERLRSICLALPEATGRRTRLGLAEGAEADALAR